MNFEALDHKVRVFVLNGEVIHFTLREVYALFKTWQVWVLFLVGFFIMSTGHPVTMPQFDSFGLRMAFWVVALLFYCLAMCWNTWVIKVIWDRVIGGPIPTFVLSIPLVLASTYAASGLLTLLFEPGRDLWSIVSWQMNVRSILVAHVFETVVLMWLIPAVRARTVPAEQGCTVTLAGRSFVLSEISRIKAAEHHLEIYNDDAVEVIRERMCTFLEQVTPKDGIQTHRSHWVAWHPAMSIKGDCLYLDCGAEVPVARGRKDDVRAWCDARSGIREMA
ncbi:MAG: LytTR family DNA-binding domain-containing protein [Tateyamaria sp.]|uniref:LytTR family DNA-binding domain-containing protein n=1 Tax=Tateyamaria sp. TaxID=1929288 RepID=UPI00326F9988